MASAAGKIVTMLPSTPQVEAVYLDDKKGILSGLLALQGDTPFLQAPASGSSSSAQTSQSSTPTPSSAPQASSAGKASDRIHTLLIDQTTLDPTVAISVAKRIQDETGGEALMMDAPVSGGECFTTCILWSGQLIMSFRNCCGCCG